MLRNILSVLGMVIIGVCLYGYVQYQKFMRGTTHDPIAIAALADRMLPGAKVPAPYVGALGIDVGGRTQVIFLDMAVLSSHNATSSPDRVHNLRFLLASGAHFPGGLPPKSETTEKLTVGGQTVPFLRWVSPQQGGSTQIQYVGQVHNVSVIISGPEKNFDRPAMDAFQSSIK